MMITKTIEELRKDLDSKSVTSKELVKESLELAHKYQEEYNSFVTICDDVEVSETLEGPLAGIPCAIKDNISTKGILTTASSNILKNYVPFYDATVVEKLKKTKVKGIVEVMEMIVIMVLLILCVSFLIDASFNPFLYFRF